MPNILIRGLSDETIERIDAEARHLGLSRNEFLRRKLEHDKPREAVVLTQEHWKRSAEVFKDLGDPEVMAEAWR